VDASQRRSPAGERAPTASQKVVKGYESLAKALAQDEPDDLSLALGIVNTVKGMKAQQGTDIPTASKELRDVAREGQKARRTLPDKKQSPEP
jgi:hypothetical protein